MYIRIPVNLRPWKYPLDEQIYLVSISRQDIGFRDHSRTDLKTVPPTFEDSLATLLIWFSPIFMIEKLRKQEIFELSKTSVLCFDYLYLVIKIIFISIVGVTIGAKNTITIVLR